MNIGELLEQEKQRQLGYWKSLTYKEWWIILMYATMKAKLAWEYFVG